MNESTAFTAVCAPIIWRGLGFLSNPYRVLRDRRTAGLFSLESFLSRPVPGSSTSSQPLVSGKTHQASSRWKTRTIRPFGCRSERKKGHLHSSGIPSHTWVLDDPGDCRYTMEVYKEITILEVGRPVI